MLASTGTDWAVYLPSYVIAVPAAILAYLGLKDRRRREDQTRVNEMVLIALWGPDQSKWPTSGGTVPPVSPLLQAVANQVRPSNGQTMAATVEQIRDTLTSHVNNIEHKIDEQNTTVGDLTKGMAAISVLVAEHVSDGHGGQGSWQLGGTP